MLRAHGRRLLRCAPSTSSASAASRTASTPRSCSASRRRGGWRIVDAPMTPRSSSSTRAASSARRRRSRSTPSSSSPSTRSAAPARSSSSPGASRSATRGARRADARGRPLPRLERHAQARQVLGGDGRAHARRQPGRLGRPASDPRVVTQSRQRVLKIAEGCNRTCAFCVIPRSAASSARARPTTSSRRPSASSPGRRQS
jgi:hypothetical protein